MKRYLLTVLALLLFGFTTAWATVPNTTSLSSYTTDGVTTVYAFTWRLIDPTQMVVTVNGATQATSSYTVYQNTNGIGGTVTFNSAPTASLPLVIQRVSDLLQMNSFDNNGAIPLKTLESMMDKVTIMCQQTAALVGAGINLTSSGASVAITGGGGTYNLDVAPSGVTPGSYTNLNATVGADGRLTSATNGSGGGGGSGTVANGVAGQVGYWAGNGATISPENNLTGAQMLPLASGSAYVGNASNVPVATALSGDITMNNAGVTTLKNTGLGSATYAYPTSITVDNQGRTTTATAGSAPAAQNYLVATVNVSSAQLLLSKTTPIILVPAPGATHLTVVHCIDWRMTRTSTGYTGGGGGHFCYRTGTVDITNGPSATVVTGSTLGTLDYVFNALDGTSTTGTLGVQNDDVIFETTSANFAAGTGTCVCTVYYSTI